MQIWLRSPLFNSIIICVITICHILIFVKFFKFWLLILNLAFWLRLHHNICLEREGSLVIVESSVQVILGPKLEQVVTVGCVKTCRSNLWRIESIICALVCLFLWQSLHVVQKPPLVFIVVKVVHYEDVSSERVIEAKVHDPLEVISISSWQPHV